MWNSEETEVLNGKTTLKATSLSWDLLTLVALALASKPVPQGTAYKKAGLNSFLKLITARPSYPGSWREQVLLRNRALNPSWGPTSTVSFLCLVPLKSILNPFRIPSRNVT